MNNYAIFKMGKLKTEKDMSDSYKHNERIYHVINADPTKEQDNIELIDTFGLTYEDLYDSTLATLSAEGVPDRTIRKDAVRGFEVILTFSREQADKIDIEEWAKANMEWLDKNFNPPDHKATYIDKNTGEEKSIEVQNIKHAIVHMDESKPHLHAFIVPIDNKGNLNSHYYNSGRAKLIQLQNEYGKAMEKFNLSRGETHSAATPEQMSRYYNNITKAVTAELPEPEKGESIEEYKARADEAYQIALCNHRDEIVKMNQEMIKLKSANENKIAHVINEQTENQKIINKINELLPEEDELERTRTVIQDIQKSEAFKKAVSNYPDSEDAEQALLMYNNLIQWQLEQEREYESKR